MKMNIEEEIAALKKRVTYLEKGEDIINSLASIITNNSRKFRDHKIATINNLNILQRVFDVMEERVYERYFKETK